MDRQPDSPGRDCPLEEGIARQGRVYVNRDRGRRYRSDGRTALDQLPLEETANGRGICLFTLKREERVNGPGLS
jgi:hypothetical protein